MKRFLLFTGLNHEECGGWDDLESAHDTSEDALAAAVRSGPKRCPVSGWDWAHIVDLETGEVDNLEELMI